MTPPRLQTPKITEAEWQQTGVDLLNALGWQHLHVRRSIGKGKKWVTATNIAGWPDLFCWKAGGGFVAIELKVGGNLPTHQQIAVLADLHMAGARTMVAYPHNFDALAAMLRGEG